MSLSVKYVHTKRRRNVSNILGNIGLCRAAGGVTTGFDSILAEVRSKRAKLVIISSDASERTKKQLRDKCAYYSVKCVETEFSAEELGVSVGKPSAVAVSFNGRGCFNKIRDHYSRSGEAE